jgi:DNA modification methylase
MELATDVMAGLLQEKPWALAHGEAGQILSGLPEKTFDCCITSPPYWSLRDYGDDRQIGLEPDPGAYIEALVSILGQVRRVLRDSGTLWLNLGDTYYTGKGACYNPGGGAKSIHHERKKKGAIPAGRQAGNRMMTRGTAARFGLKPKDLIGIPWMAAFALRASGWYLRSRMIWHKGNGMPESVQDRPTRCSEEIFLLTKSDTYYWDHEAAQEPAAESSLERMARGGVGSLRANGGSREDRPMKAVGSEDGYRNIRDVITMGNRAAEGEHYASFPVQLIDPWIRILSRPGSLVLDPFAGTGTTGVAAMANGRKFFGIDVNAGYLETAERRLKEATAQGKLFE